jgi:hypothetical protein
MKAANWSIKCRSDWFIHAPVIYWRYDNNIFSSEEQTAKEPGAGFKAV